ncbi:MAG: DUF302 domain-containing protein [Glaciimonas sp.]|nr:DUF302 domain-containing protein [Glaciimonas sp.]
MKTLVPAKTSSPFPPLHALFFSCLLLAASSLAHAEIPAPYPGTQTVSSQHSFDTLLQRLERAISDNQMGLVAQASASKGAAARGVKIPGNAVLMVFRNDYAVRMLEASLPAGIEAPLRLYVTENKNGTASVSYRTPSATFAPYGSRKLDAVASELDPIFAKIVADATGK